MDITLTQLQEAIFTQRDWKQLFRNARTNGKLPFLIQRLHQLPDSPEKRAKILVCQFALSQTDKDRKKIAHELGKIKDSLFAQGWRLAILMEGTSTKEKRQLLPEEDKRRRSFREGVRASDYDGLGFFALSMAAGYASLCNPEKVMEELDEATNNYGPFKDPELKLKVDHQRFRLDFILGRYEEIMANGPELLKRAEEHHPPVCDCIKNYMLMASVLQGEHRHDLFSPETYDLFLGSIKMESYLVPSNEAGTTLELYAAMVGFVGELHLHLPVRHVQVNHNAIQYWVDLIKNCIAYRGDEVAELLSVIAEGIMEAYLGNHHGLEKLVFADLPFLRYSLPMQIMFSACLLEAHILLPENRCNVDVSQHLEHLRQVHTLNRHVRKFLWSWMHNLAPHVLWFLSQQTCDSEVRAAATGFLVVSQGKVQLVGQEHQTISNYPVRVVPKHIFSVMKGRIGDLPERYTTYVSGFHLPTMKLYQAKRVIIDTLLTPVRDTLKQA